MTQGMQGPDPLIGATVSGKYKIIKLLGEGGMGCVYLGEQMLGSTARKVAVKTLHKHLSHDASIQARFDREAGTVAGLEHPNTIQVFDYGKMDDGTLYIVMEFVQGKSVADIIVTEGAMPPARVENIMRQVCGSLEEAHHKGIVHRDLKPDNVVLCERAGVKDWVEVLDFGIAKRSTEHDPNEAKLTQQGMVLGTPPYMSPEQFTGQPVDARSDIYALGIMAYEMLVGVLPFEANTAWEWASKHMTAQPRPIETQNLGPGVPEKMRSAINRALAKNPNDRFSTVKEFFEAFSVGAGSTLVEAPQAMGRAKTEMAQPAAITPAPFGGPTPPFGAGSMGNPTASPRMGGPPPAYLPAGPAHASHQQKNGGSGLVIGLGALALVLLLGGVGAYFATRSKTPAPVPVVIDTATTSASVAASTPPTPPDETTVNVAPLTPGTAPGTSVTHAPTTVKDAGAAVKPSASAVKPPPPSEPPACVQARAQPKGSPVYRRLESLCIGAGGHI